MSIKTSNNGTQSYDQELSPLACSRCEKETLATQFEKATGEKVQADINLQIITKEKESLKRAIEAEKDVAKKRKILVENEHHLASVQEKLQLKIDQSRAEKDQAEARAANVEADQKLAQQQTREKTQREEVQRFSARLNDLQM